MAIPFEKLVDVAKRFAKLSPKKSLKPESTRTLGLNIGRSSLVACEMLKEDNKQLIERCARKELTPNKSLTVQIKEFIQESGFQSKRVNASLKGQGVVIRFVSFPKMNRADFASSIQFEAEKYLPFSVSEVVLDYYISADGAPSSDQDPATMSVILVAARKTEVDKLLNAAQGAGLRLDAIDLDAFALANAFEHANPDAKKHAVGLIDFGAVDTTFVILDKGKMTFSRDIAFGGNDLVEMVRRKLNIPVEQAAKIPLEPKLTQPDQFNAVVGGLDRLFQELKSSINYYYNQHQNVTPLETIYISGGFSQLSVLPELLEKQAEIPVKRWDPTVGISLAPDLKHDDLKNLVPYLPISVGLAIRPR